jgi:hypothetical protein
VFEAKSYNGVNRTLFVANTIFAGGSLVLLYAYALTPAHKAAFQSALSVIRFDPLFKSILTVSLAAAVWGYLATFMLRLHDRLYEPHLVTWRAPYEVDYILRSLCAAYPERLSEQFFERAFDDPVARGRFMQRLFYRFIGDSKTLHEELLVRFYTTIRNYWILVLAEVYCLGFLIFTAGYCYFAAQTAPPYGTWASVLSASILLRFWANRYLREIRPITAEQVSAVVQEHLEDFRRALGTILNEYNF